MRECSFISASARAFAVLDGVNHFTVLLLRQDQAAKRARRLGVGHHKARGEQRQALDPLQLALHEVLPDISSRMS
jgi:hypothetical protein